jgi:hypothetical protein
VGGMPAGFDPTNMSADTMAQMRDRMQDPAMLKMMKVSCLGAAGLPTCTGCGQGPLQGGRSAEQLSRGAGRSRSQCCLLPLYSALLYMCNACLPCSVVC